MEFIDQYSRAHKNITVVQVGANDGFNHDPIHIFIKRDQWNGVLLEPQKEVYRKYLKKLHRKSKGMYTLNAALDHESGEKPIYKIAFSQARWATGLTTFKKFSLEKVIASGYVEKAAKKEGVKLPANKENYIKRETISCISLDLLLQKYNLKNIDWLQIDTEGFDFEIIKMFRIDQTKPKVIVYENDHLKEDEKQQCLELLTKHRYQIKKFGKNTVAMRNTGLNVPLIE